MKTIVAMSDTHGRHQNLEVPDGDVLIHAGDFCRYGSRADVHEFAEWFTEFPHEHKVVIAGNHDLALEKYLGYGHMLRMYEIEYLEDTRTAIQDGPKIWGSPYTPPFQDWAFMLPEEALARKFALIPDDVDVLVTHGPPAGVLDFTDLEGVLAGSLALSSRIDELMYGGGRNRKLVHIFGHIHERWGHLTNGGYRAYNVAICDFKYNPVNQCTVIEWG